jgi:hypothetical protein
MAANGGWIASATDLARLLVKVDGFASKPDILSANSVTTMTTPSAVTNYALGWNVNNSNHWWHLGSLPGTTTEIVRTSTGYCWVVLCNTRSNAAAFTTDLDNLIWQAVNNGSTAWPEVDLF